VKRNPFSGLEKEKKFVWQYTRGQTNQADTTLQSFIASFPQATSYRNQSLKGLMVRLGGQGIGTRIT